MLPLKNKRFQGKLVICNLQPTKYDNKADLVISTYVDTILEKVAKRLGVEIQEYTESIDPIRQEICDLEWTITTNQLKEIDEQYKQMIKNSKKRKLDGGTKEKASKDVKRQKTKE